MHCRTRLQHPLPQSTPGLCQLLMSEHPPRTGQPALKERPMLLAADPASALPVPTPALATPQPVLQMAFVLLAYQQLWLRTWANPMAQTTRPGLASERLCQAVPTPLQAPAAAMAPVPHDGLPGLPCGARLTGPKHAAGRWRLVPDCELTSRSRRRSPQTPWQAKQPSTNRIEVQIHNCGSGRDGNSSIGSCSDYRFRRMQSSACLGCSARACPR